MDWAAAAAALSRSSEGSRYGPPIGHNATPKSWGHFLVLTPDIADLPFTMDNGVKVFHLIAEPVKQMIIPGRTFDLWGFNGSAPGPTIQANEGDRVRIVFDNHLPEPTGIHWHGLELPIEMDGVPGIGQKPVMPGERFVYEFPLHQNGTFFYHSHMAMQEMVGMLGGFIIHPKTPYTPRVDKDYLIALQEYAVLPNSTIPNSMNMEFNWLTFNGKAGPCIDAADHSSGRTRPHPDHQSRHGPPSDSSSWVHILGNGTRGSTPARGDLAARETRPWSAWRRRVTSSSWRTASATGCSIVIFPTT